MANIVDGVYENLHATTQTEDEHQGLVLKVRKTRPVAGKSLDKDLHTATARRRIDIVDGFGRLDLEGDGLASKSFDED